MEIQFNVTGAERKALVAAISQCTVSAPVYKGAPNFVYEVAGFTVGRDGTLTGDITLELLDALAARGFTSAHGGTAQTDAPDILVIEMPGDGFTDLTFANLERLVESKGELIMRSLGTDALSIERGENKLRFPWLDSEASAELVDACTHFITALCKMAKGLRRVTAKQKAVENEKYAFRCFLLRLGFIGTDYKGVRKILLENLDGDAAFKQPPTNRGGTNTGGFTAETIPPVIETAG